MKRGVKVSEELQENAEEGGTHRISGQVCGEQGEGEQGKGGEQSAAIQMCWSRVKRLQEENVSESSPHCRLSGGPPEAVGMERGASRAHLMCS